MFLRFFIFGLLMSASAGPAGGAALPDAQPYAFEGKWDCEGQDFTFVNGAWNNGTETLGYVKVEQEGEDYLIHFSDGYRFALLDVSENAMTWHSPESGDQFQCERTK